MRNMGGREGGNFHRHQRQEQQRTYQRHSIALQLNSHLLSFLCRLTKSRRNATKCVVVVFLIISGTRNGKLHKHLRMAGAGLLAAVQIPSISSHPPQLADGGILPLLAGSILFLSLCLLCFGLGQVVLGCFWCFAFYAKHACRACERRCLGQNANLEFTTTSG